MDGLADNLLSISQLCFDHSNKKFLIIYPKVIHFDQHFSEYFIWKHHFESILLVLWILKCLALSFILQRRKKMTRILCCLVASWAIARINNRKPYNDFLKIGNESNKQTTNNSMYRLPFVKFVRLLLFWPFIFLFINVFTQDIFLNFA